MKKYLALFSFAGIITACNDTTNSSNIASDTSLTAIEAPLIADGQQDRDTFSIGNKRFIISSLQHSSFDKQEKQEEQDHDYNSTENELLEKDKEQVKRTGDSLLFLLKNGKTAVLTNNTREESDQYAVFFYAGYIPSIHQYIAFGSYYESSDYVLVDADNGAITHVWGIPVISPDNKYFICPSFDLIARFNDNGFQLFSYQDGKIVPEGDISFNTWGPGQMKWLDNHTIEAEYITLEDAINEVQLTKPVKITMQ
jgi:hypothetical protein